jgi:acyl-coenzyme A thioesterase PaaI-like protein
MRSGHAAGEFVEASKWKVLREEKGFVELDVHLPKQLLNPFGQLFGGFTGTYIDMVSIYVVRTLYAGQPGYTRSSTVNMRIDYLQPVLGPRFRLVGEAIKDGRSTCLTATKFLDNDHNLLVYAITTLRQQFDETNGQS